ATCTLQAAQVARLCAEMDEFFARRASEAPAELSSEPPDPPQPFEQPQQRRQRKPSLARLVAKAKQLGIAVTVEPNGAVPFHTGTASAPVDKPQTELDEWIAKHAH